MTTKNILAEVQNRLTEIHKNLGIPILKYQSSIAGNIFPGEFNVSGFHKEVLNLSDNTGSFYGTDRILRIKDEVDNIHSNIFYMGIFAKGIDLKNDFTNPFKDKRFYKIQEEIFKQFFQVLKQLNILPHELEATYFNGCKVGGASDLKYRNLLKKQYAFPTDSNSAKILEEYGVKYYPVNSATNLDIIPYERSLIGPRLEIAYRGLEIGTIIFDCFRIEKGRLLPINYVGGYALGIERLALSLSEEKSLLGISPKIKKAMEFLSKKVPATKSSLLTKETLITIFGTEVLAHISEISLSKGQKELLRQLKKKIFLSVYQLGGEEKTVKELIEIYQNESTNYWS